MRHSNTPYNTTQFAGLTRHNNAEMTDRAAGIAGIDPDDPPETSLATAIRNLEQADAGGLSWKVPEQVSQRLDEEELTDTLPDGMELHRVDDSTVFVETDRFQSVYSPDKLRDWVNADDDTEEVADPLWHVPTNTYSIVNPLNAYEPLEEAIRDEGYGDDVFGEIREYKEGGEVHMDVLFDAFQIDYNEGDDDNSRDPIVLGVRTGYDFFGSQALYFEGFAQDTRCDNSIRAITEKKTIRHVGEVDLEDEVHDVLEEMELMTNRLAELIEMAEEIEVDVMEMEFSEPFDHSDNIRGFYELAGFPSYLAREAATHARQRADNVFLPDMTALWDGATYALTHHYQGGENTSTAQDYIDRANDMVMNPTQVIGQVSQEHTRRLEAQAEAGDVELEGEAAHASIEEFEQSVREKADEFESRNEELRTTLLAEAGGGEDEVATDGGEDA
jgi:hypothetical protein